MFNGKWQVGLHLQSDYLTAIAVQRRRGRWHLKRWWSFSVDFPLDDFAEDAADVAQLTTHLTCLARDLPSHYSLRVSYPPRFVSHYSLPLPPTALAPPQLNRYVAQAMTKRFSQTKALHWDHRLVLGEQMAIDVTLTRKKLFADYCYLFHQAKLRIEVLEVTPAGLQVLLRGFDNCCLLFQDNDFWYWAAHGVGQWRYGWRDRQQFSSLTEVIASLEQPYQRYFSTNNILENDRPKCEPFCLLSLLDNYYPPLPVELARFSIALGLALRPEDRP